jgi:hypothetical protein
VRLFQTRRRKEANSDFFASINPNVYPKLSRPLADLNSTANGRQASNSKEINLKIFSNCRRWRLISGA